LLDRDAALARLEESVSIAAAAQGINREVDLSDLENVLIIAIAVISPAAPSIIDVEARALFSSRVNSAYRCGCGNLSWSSTA
jgi:hypothetical protein